MTYRHPVRIRYADCDMQGVVYNSHYLTFMDDAFDCWLRTLDDNFEAQGWEVMLKAVELEWHAPARLAETLEVLVDVTRWGNTSMGVTFKGSVADTAVFDATIAYVIVDSTQYRPVPIPDALRDHLSK